MNRQRLGWSIVVLGLPLAVLALTSWLRHGRWVLALREGNPAVRAAALREMPLAGNEGLVIGALDDEDRDVHLLAAGRLGDPGGKGPAWAGDRRSDRGTMGSPGCVFTTRWRRLRRGPPDPGDHSGNEDDQGKFTAWRAATQANPQKMSPRSAAGRPVCNGIA